MSWNDAKTFCMNEGGKLFEPRDSAENSEVPNYAFNTARLEVFWFGIEDLSSEGTFVYARMVIPLLSLIGLQMNQMI